MDDTERRLRRLEYLMMRLATEFYGRLPQDFQETVAEIVQEINDRDDDVDTEA